MSAPERKTPLGVYTWYCGCEYEVTEGRLNPQHAWWRCIKSCEEHPSNLGTEAENHDGAYTPRHSSVREFTPADVFELVEE